MSHSSVSVIADHPRAIEYEEIYDDHRLLFDSTNYSDGGFPAEKSRVHRQLNC